MLSWSWPGALSLSAASLAQPAPSPGPDALVGRYEREGGAPDLRGDEQDNIPIAETVRRIEEFRARAVSGDVTLRVSPRLGHALWDDERGWIAQNALDLLTGWIESHALFERNLRPTGPSPCRSARSVRCSA